MDKKRGHLLIGEAHRLEHGQPVDAMRRDEDTSLPITCKSRPYAGEKQRRPGDSRGETDAEADQGIEP